MGATDLRPDRDAGDFWAITAYFNPAGYRSKYANYRQFRKHLALPLVAIELSYGPDFELKDDDAEIVLRRRGRDVLWQKERLLNIALAALPSHCRRVRLGGLRRRLRDQRLASAYPRHAGSLYTGSAIQPHTPDAARLRPRSATASEYHVAKFCVISDCLRHVDCGVSRLFSLTDPMCARLCLGGGSRCP